MEKIKLTGLWKNTDKSGDIYYAGNLSPSAGLAIHQGVAARSSNTQVIRPPYQAEPIVRVTGPSTVVTSDTRPQPKSMNDPPGISSVR